MELQAWPFFISSHKVQGFTVVVAPDFMCQDHSAKILASYAGGEPGDVKHCEISKIENVTGETLTLTYRVVQAEGSLVGEDAAILRDAGGRAIPIIEGIVTKGKDKNITLTESAFNTIREACEQEYKSLWKSPVIIPTQPSTSITISAPSFFLDENSEKTASNWFSQTSLEENTPIIVMGLIILIVIVFLILIFIGNK